MFNRPRLVGGALAIFALAVTAPAQDADESIAISCGWEKGDRICFESEQTRRELKDGRKLELKSGSSHDVFDVVDVTDQYYVIAWTRTSTEFDALNPLPSDAQQSMKLTESLTIELIIGRENFLFYGIRNYEEVKPALERAVSRMSADFVRSGMSREQADRVKAKMETALRSIGGAAVYLADDVLGMLTPYGREISTRREFREDGTMANPFGGQPLDAPFVWLKARQLRANDDAYVIEWRQVVPRGDLARITRDMLRTAGVEDAQVERRARQLMRQMEFSRKASYTYDVSDELVVQASRTTHNEVAGNGDIETWEWTVVECNQRH